MTLDFRFYSDSLGKNVPVRVLYPDHPAVDHPLPVLYLLHGLGDDYSFWTRKTCIENYTEGRPLVVIMPDGDVSWYCDMARGRRYFTYLTEELPCRMKDVLRGLSDQREDTFIGGASMGGYGAFRAAMTYPERYGKAFSFSGALDIEALLPWIERGILENAMGPIAEAMTDVVNPYLLAEKLAASGKIPPDFYMWCGYGDFLYEANVSFKTCMQRLSLPLIYREGEGTHSWPDWDRELVRVLDEFILPA